jgi:endonuclease-3
MDKKTIKRVITKLTKNNDIKVGKGEPFEVLVHGVLSARTKDSTTDPAVKRLLSKANTPQKILKLKVEAIQKTIFPVGFYRVKSKRLKEVCRDLVDKFDGKVPRTRKELMGLPGVGGKIADIVLLFAYGESVIPVDTHVEVISKRWHIADKNDTPEKVRDKLHKLFAEKDRLIVNQLLVKFGKEICKAPYPKCSICPIVKLCPYENKRMKKVTNNQ